MTDCEDFEMLTADALGNELSEADRPAFEAHLAQCEKCRREYETASRTVSMMRALPGPTRVTIRREGDRLVIDDGRSPLRRTVLPDVAAIIASSSTTLQSSTMSRSDITESMSIVGVVTATRSSGSRLLADLFHVETPLSLFPCAPVDRILHSPPPSTVNGRLTLAERGLRQMS